MEISLTHKVNEGWKIYKGQVEILMADKVTRMEIIVFATSSEEAISKLKEFMFQEYPSMEQSKATYRVSGEMALT